MLINKPKKPKKNTNINEQSSNRKRIHVIVAPRNDFDFQQISLLSPFCFFVSLSL